MSRTANVTKIKIVKTPQVEEESRAHVIYQIENLKRQKAFQIFHFVTSPWWGGRRPGGIMESPQPPGVARRMLRVPARAQTSDSAVGLGVAAALARSRTVPVSPAPGRASAGPSPEPPCAGDSEPNTTTPGPGLPDILCRQARAGSATGKESGESGAEKGILVPAAAAAAAAAAAVVAAAAVAVAAVVVEEQLAVRGPQLVHLQCASVCVCVCLCVCARVCVC